eukprot:COSAG05_NODE_5935_length_1055_cov_1.501046_2_plen_76_part_01
MEASTLHELNAGDMQALLSVGATTPEQLVAACYHRIRERNDSVGAWAHLDEQAAIAASRSGGGEAPHPLRGVPFAA